jgi:hypothetical protein
MGPLLICDGAHLRWGSAPYPHLRVPTCAVAEVHRRERAATFLSLFSLGVLPSRVATDVAEGRVSYLRAAISATRRAMKSGVSENPNREKDVP